MELVPYGDGDMALTESMERDPAVMKELGGPVPRERIPVVHAKRVMNNANGFWWFKIVPEPGGPAAGTIGVWPMEWEGKPAYEMGWMLLVAYQGRGLASAAAKLLVERARAEGRWDAIHAFPGASNVPSNAICRKAGFTRLENLVVEYAGRRLNCVHWRVDLKA